MARSRNFAFTVNNYTDEHQAQIKALKYKYLVYGYEIGASGTPHLQGHVSLVDAVTENSIRKKIPGHVEIARDNEKSIAYCKKGGNYFEDGSPFSNGQTKRILVTRDLIWAQETWSDVLALPGVANKMAFAKECWRLKERPIETVEELWGWQQEELDSLLIQDDRTIRFVVDHKGGMGKTVLAKYLTQNYKAFYCRGGKHADIAYAYQGQNIVVFDLARCNSGEQWPYQMMENFKDGMVFSGKYESEIKTGPPCKVIVFCNEYPDQSKLSQDRISIREEIACVFNK